MPDKILLYAHAGSGNHGCEAIVRSVCEILGNDNKPVLISNDVEEDRKYGLGDVCRLIQEKKIEKHFFTHVWYYLVRKITGNGESFLDYRYSNAKPYNDYRVAVSIGGDNYCYDMMVKDLENANKMFHSKGLQTILLGCSVEPKLLKRLDILSDMKLYDRIIARESITYKALVDAGLKNVVLCPDPAFSLKPKETDIPQEMQDGNIVGINISPMVQDCAGDNGVGIVFENYERLIGYILDNTDMKVVLVPHVVWDRNNDRIPTDQLWGKYRESGRVFKIEDRNCQELKMIISKCRFFVGARTHATIAAYSSCVPTLVAGYSVKSRGIAKDLFGTDENYVIPVQNMKSTNELTDGFKWLCDHEKEIKDHLGEVMPEYISRTERITEYLTEFI